MADFGPGHLTLRLLKLIRIGFKKSRVISIRRDRRNVYVTRNHLPRSIREAPPGNNIAVILSHWFHLVNNFRDSSLGFYDALEETIRSRQLPRVECSRIRYLEGGIFSPKREFLRVRQKEYIFDICASAFGRGFFISWWLGIAKRSFLWQLLSVFPFVDRSAYDIVQRVTYYKLDTALMFQESIQAALLEVLDRRTSSQGIRGPAGRDRRPILSELFRQGRY